MKCKNLIENGYKNQCFYLKNYQVNKQKLKQLKKIRMKHTSTPLLQLSIFDLSNFNQQDFIINVNYVFRRRLISQQLTEFKQKQYNKILILHANIVGNAQRNVLLNTKRSCLIEYLNTYSSKNLVYFITLSKITQFVPDQQIILHLNEVLIDKKTSKQLSKNKQIDIVQNKNKQNIFDVLFPFNLFTWSAYAKNKLNFKSDNLRLENYQQNNIQIQIYNAYKIKFAKNSQSLYEDVKDFSKMLLKFNFFRYFNQIQNDEGNCLNNCSRLIKGINWKSHESEQYFLFILRSEPLSRFLPIINNFLQLYQKKFNFKQDILQ